MKKKSSTKSTQDSTGTTSLVQTPTNPAWVDSGLQGLGGQISNLSAADPYSFVAGPDPLQAHAGQAAAGLSSSPNFGQASDMLTRASGAGPNLAGAPASLLDNLQAYMSPYTDRVVNSTLAGFDDNSGRVRAQQQLDLAGDGTFGGSGGSILRSLTEGQLGLGRAQTEAQLRDQAFTTGAGLSGQDAARRQQAAQFDATQRDNDVQRQLAAALGLADVGTAAGADARSNVATQATIGDMLQQLAQRRAVAPLSLLGTQATLFSGLPLGLLHGENSNGTSDSHTTGSSTTTVSDPMGTIAGLAAGAGSLASGLGAMGIGFSDIRLKQNVVKLGERPDGLGVYAFDYIWGGPRQIGVMAHEVAKVKPGAVHTHPSGYLMVDYGAI